MHAERGEDIAAKSLMTCCKEPRPAIGQTRTFTYDCTNCGAKNVVTFMQAREKMIQDRDRPTRERLHTA